MKLIKPAAASFLWLFAGAAFAQGDPHCKDEENFSTCFSRLANGETTAGADDAAAAAAPTVAAMNTGDNEQSTTNDFLPLLRLLLNDEGNSDENRKIGFEWAPHFSASLPSKVTVTLQDSELYAPLAAALEAADLTDQSQATAKKIDAGDDVAVTFTISKASEHYGRDPDLQNKLLGALADAANDDDAPRSLKQARLNSDSFRRGHGSISPTVAFADIADETTRAQYRDLVEAQIALEIDYLKNFAERLDKFGFYGLLELIDNQPQLTFAVSYQSRGEAVGPDDVKATFAYEFGGRNVNTFRKFAHHDCRARVAGNKLESEVACLAEYVGKEETMAESFRVKVSAEYSKLQRYEFELADTAFSYIEKPVKHLAFSAAASRQLGAAGVGKARPRFDAKLTYEDFSDDPQRQDRGIATVTFSYPVAQGFFVTLGGVYATRPEFRGDVDGEISTRLGFTYKFIEDK